NYQEDSEDIIIDFMESRVMDHSAIEAINSITEKYRNLGKTLHLRHLSSDCRQLLKNAEKLIEVNISEDPDYHIADNQLA
ncbi:MAG: STAS domain-containing protein, partial [Spirochaetales bacterium]|nr:STAS domain-containing protein [Spirochaetales bacterium]